MRAHRFAGRTTAAYEVHTWRAASIRLRPMRKKEKQQSDRPDQSPMYDSVRHDKLPACWKIRRDRLVDHKSKPRYGVKITTTLCVNVWSEEEEKSSAEARVRMYEYARHCRNRFWAAKKGEQKKNSEKGGHYCGLFSAENEKKSDLCRTRPIIIWREYWCDKFEVISEFSRDIRDNEQQNLWKLFRIS